MAVNSFFGTFIAILASELQGAAAVMVILFGGALIVATDFQIGKMKRRQGGTESATAVLGVGYFLGGVLWLIAQAGSGGDENAFINVALVLAGLVLGAAAWRWGYWIFAVAAMVAVFVLLARMPLGRLLWIVLPLILAPFLLRAGESAARPPAHRRAADALLAVSLVFLYLAVHLGSWDEKILEQLRGGSPDLTPIALLRFASALATAAVPVIVLLVGVFRRRRLLINLGLVGILASVITLRFYVHVMPHWAALLLGGVVAVAVALLTTRFLDSGEDQERNGLTAEPLYDDAERRSALEIAAGVVSATPAARQTGSPGFEGGGGRSGGGGATETI
jgi:MFS family permease